VLLPRCVRLVLQGRVRLHQGRTVVRDVAGDALALFGA
jgi:hypothetical protein